MKAILAVALVATAIAIPFVAPAIAGALGIAGSLGAIAVTAGLEVGLSLIQSAILGPSVPKSITSTATSRLYATLVTTEPRKIFFGITAGGTDIRYL